MRRIGFRRPSPPMVVAFVALMVALAGTSYAAIQLPANSVGTKQLKKNAVTGKKVKNRSLKAVDFATGQLPAGPKGDQGPAGPAGATNVTVREGAPGVNRSNASCQPGERAVGGGGTTSNGVLDESKPTPTGGTPTGWTATAYDGMSTADVQAFVVCAAP
jgi:hypothetical protein